MGRTSEYIDSYALESVTPGICMNPRIATTRVSSREWFGTSTSPSTTSMGIVRTFAHVGTDTDLTHGA